MQRKNIEINSVTDYLLKVRECEECYQKVLKEKIEYYRNRTQDNSGLQEALRYYEEHQMCPIMYRGHSDESYKLYPSAYREKSKGPHYYYNEARRIYPDAFQRLCIFEALSKMQHYGIPTSLLDVTTNPLVALFFACCSKKEKNGIVYSFPALPISNENEIVKSVSKYTVLSADEQDAYLREHEIDKENLFVVRPCCVDDRMIRQQGYFILCAKKDERISKASLFSLKIHQKDKTKILEELDKLGINEFTLFGSLDYLGKYLSRIP
jgi:hypothetical protein